MRTVTERVARTRVRVSAADGGGRCRVLTTLTRSDPCAAGLRPFVVHRDQDAARVSLVPDGALLLAGDSIELDVTVDAGARLDLIEPGGTVAFDMRGARASWDVRVRVGPDAVLTWAGEPFVVSAGADVRRRTDLHLAEGARAALRETLVLGRYGEWPGSVRQHTAVRVAGRPVLVEELPIDPTSAPGLLGGHRVLSSVLAVGAVPDLGGPDLGGPDLGGPELGGPDLGGPDLDRYDLGAGGHLWRRIGAQAHHVQLAAAWSRATALMS